MTRDRLAHWDLEMGVEDSNRRTYSKKQTTFLVMLPVLGAVDLETDNVRGFRHLMTSLVVTQLARMVFVEPMSYSMGSSQGYSGADRKGMRRQQLQGRRTDEDQQYRKAKP